MKKDSRSAQSIDIFKIIKGNNFSVICPAVRDRKDVILQLVTYNRFLANLDLWEAIKNLSDL